MKLTSLYTIPRDYYKNKRLRAYYNWRLRTKAKIALGIVHKTLNIITPSHTYEKRSAILHRALASILAQKPHGLTVNHIIVFDGKAPDKIDLDTLHPAWYKQRIIATDPTRVYGAHQRNVGLENVERGWVLFLDDDNVLDENACAVIEKELDAAIGILVFKVWHAELNKFVPADPSKMPQYADIDSLSVVINTDVSSFATWQPLYHHDFMYIQNVWAMASHYGYRCEYRDKLIGTHI